MSPPRKAPEGAVAARRASLLDKLIVAMDAADDHATSNPAHVGNRSVEIVLAGGCLIARATYTREGFVPVIADRRISLDMIEASKWEYVCREIVEQAVAAL